MHTPITPFCVPGILIQYIAEFGLALKITKCVRAIWRDRSRIFCVANIGGEGLHLRQAKRIAKSIPHLRGPHLAVDVKRTVATVSSILGIVN